MDSHQMHCDSGIIFIKVMKQIDAIITNAYDLRTYKNARLSFDIAYAPQNATDTFMVIFLRIVVIRIPLRF
jgi:hypothetical protein